MPFFPFGKKTAYPTPSQVTETPVSESILLSKVKKLNVGVNRQTFVPVSLSLNAPANEWNKLLFYYL